MLRLNDTIECLSAKMNRQKIQQTLDQNFLFLRGRSHVTRNNDCDYPFRQYSDFLYLTGVHLEDACLLLTQTEEYLFIPDISVKFAVWLGHQPGKNESKSLYHFSHVFFISELSKVMKKISKRHTQCLCIPEDKAWIKKNLRPNSMDSKILTLTLKEIRMTKNRHEISIMQTSADIASLAHTQVMQHTKPGMFEYEVQGVFEKTIMDHGIRSVAYQTIVASGHHSAVLHYHHNHKRIKKGDFLLIDAGAEYKGYASDITRTFPVGRKFTTREKDIYELVLNTQIQCIEHIRKDIKLSSIQQLAEKLLAQGLIDLGLLKGQLNHIIEKRAHRLFFPHGVSHMLGLDVHDTYIKIPSKSGLRADFYLKENYVITVEPGLYFIPALLNDAKSRRKFKHLVNFHKTEPYMYMGGVRIEDDVWVTQNGRHVLSTVPKHIPDMYKCMGY